MRKVQIKINGLALLLCLKMTTAVAQDGSILGESVLESKKKPLKVGRFYDEHTSLSTSTGRKKYWHIDNYQQNPVLQPQQRASPRVPNPPGTVPIPIDGGAGLLLLAGASYGATQIRRKRRP